MELFEAIAGRHSYRGEFKNIPVPREDLRKIVEAGIMAPSGCNAQTTHFAIVDDPVILTEIGKIVSKTAVQTAPAIIAVIMKAEPAYPGMCFGVQDYSAAVQNMLLAITGLGYASVWLDGVLRLGDIAERIGSLLNVPQGQNMTVTVILPVGIPEEEGRQNDRLPFEQRAWYNRHS
jgi:nitroreductase